MRAYVLAMAAAITAGCSSPVSTPFRNAGATNAIVRSLPTGWALAEVTPDQIPQGHYQSGHHGGERLVIVGPRDVPLKWLDSTGQWHHDPLMSESLELWVMPGSYRDSWRSWVDLHRPVAASVVYGGTDLRVYGIASHRVKSEPAFWQAIEQARATMSPDAEPSWTTWTADIRKHLEANVTK